MAGLPQKYSSISGVAALWVATLYFTQGLPNTLVEQVSPVVLKDLNVGNALLTVLAGWAYLPWVLKALWSPVVDSLGRKRGWIVGMQFLGAAALAAFALGIGFFHASQNFALVAGTALFFVAAASATHDIAADGFYMLALDSGRQALFTGLRSTFFRLSMIFGKGGVIAFAGWLMLHCGAEISTEEKARVWRNVLLALAALTAFFAAFHFWILPRTEKDVPAREREGGNLLRDFVETWSTFFKKEKIGELLAFLLLFRLGEVHIGALSAAFFKDEKDLGGLALDNRTLGELNGVYGTLALLAGGILAGWLVSRSGLRRWLVPMILLLNVPDFFYVAVAHWQPGSTALIGAGIVVEQFGYGFGFTGYMLYMLYACAGTRRAVAHYAICTGFMALGVMLPKFWAGRLQEFLGYENFFWFAILCTLPGFLLVAHVRRTLPADFGKKFD